MKGTSSQRTDLVGAVMVVGGGIAGMQAALDLAEQGFKVYQVESQSAIGGHMAQLDKTFPTNDCSMCTISPKLVDVGRHLNIEVMTQAEVVDVTGAAGNFAVRVHHKPRYIDLDKCVGCGDCADVCPVILPDEFNERLGTRRAAYKLYPQAVPNAYAIEKRGVAPCRDACPSGQRAQGYIALIREGRYEDALRVIKEDNPFPGICGRICNHRCEDACNRAKLDEAINIRALKRFVTDKVYSQTRVLPKPLERAYGERVAVIGAGPCGLTAAQDLCVWGYAVTVFEALPVAGGMLRVGVPEYRLPSWIVDREVQDIVDLGVELRLNSCVDSLDDLFAQGFDAVLIAVGAHEGIRLPIPGADAEGVLLNTSFLRDVRLGNLPHLGKQVAVVGAGDVAMDVARTALRMGAEVHVYYRRTREEATAASEEMRHSEEEGVVFHWQTTPIEIVADEDGRVEGMICVRTERGLPDETGRRRPVRIPESEHLVACDNVIFSVGQRAGLAFIPESAGVGITSQQTIAVNPNTLAATRGGVFAAGDATTGTSFVIEAVSSGHQAAESVHRYLRGEELDAPPKPQLPVVELTRAEIEARVASGDVVVGPRVSMDELAVVERISTFDEVVAGYTDEQAQAEAARCLSCGICSECLSCQYACEADAIVHDMTGRTETVNVGAIILATGFTPYQAQESQEYGYGRYLNVITSLQFERMLSASGPTEGHVVRPSDHKPARKIAFLQCVGSRDQHHDYCSSVCCMYATKQAIMAKEHEPDTEIHVFMMDMRSFSKGYEEYYHRAREKYGVQYTRCRISAVRQNQGSANLILRYVPDDGSDRTLAEEEFDLVVLSIGMEISDSARALARQLGIQLDEYGFARTGTFAPLETSRPGILAIGPFREPKDIPESVVEASAGAAAAARLLAPVRGTLAAKRAYPAERDASTDGPRVGVFVCHCGSNIGGFLNVPEVSEYARTLAGVVHAEHNLYTCSQDSIVHITEQVKALDLNRVVVASCTPITHEPLFRDSIRMAGLNPFLFEMANIRNHCSWVHSDNREVATEKAKALVRMAVARANLLLPQPTREMPIEKSALVIGGGVAGMNAALSLADQGFPVHLIERSAQLGGNLRNIHYLADYGSRLTGSRDPQLYLASLTELVSQHPLIELYLDTELEQLGGFVGKFSSRLRRTSRGVTEILDVNHGAVIVATGAREYRGPEYGYGQHRAVATQQEFEALLADSSAELPQSIAMIQCIGPAEQYCSRTCCTVALKNALRFKDRRPDGRVVVLYKDIRTFGFKERLYTEARRRGVLFVRYDDNHKPAVSFQDDAPDIIVWEPLVERELRLRPDLLVLSMPQVPAEGTTALVSKLRVSVDLDGWFMEAHVKLRPVDFSSEGIFVAGAAHYPKFLDETIVQAEAAASRAANILAHDTRTVGGQVAVVDTEKCVGCLTCVRICPFDVPEIRADLVGVGRLNGAATIEPAMCQGCGSCVAECPAKAISLMHYTDLQMLAKVDALFDLLPREAITVV